VKGTFKHVLKHINRIVVSHSLKLFQNQEQQRKIKRFQVKIQEPPQTEHQMERQQ
jgi:hypothetical protein